MKVSKDKYGKPRRISWSYSCQRNELIASGVHSDDPIQKKLKALAQQIEEVIETFSTSVSKDNQSKMRSTKKRH